MFTRVGLASLGGICPLMLRSYISKHWLFTRAEFKTSFQSTPLNSSCFYHGSHHGNALFGPNLDHFTLGLEIEAYSVSRTCFKSGYRTWGGWPIIVLFHFNKHLLKGYIGGFLWLQLTLCSQSVPHVTCCWAKIQKANLKCNMLKHDHSGVCARKFLVAKPHQILVPIHWTPTHTSGAGPASIRSRRVG